jgi:hypothetical protein
VRGGDNTLYVLRLEYGPETRSSLERLPSCIRTRHDYLNAPGFSDIIANFLRLGVRLSPILASSMTSLCFYNLLP